MSFSLPKGELESQHLVTHNVILFEDRVFTEVIKIKKTTGVSFNPRIASGYPYKKGKFGHSHKGKTCEEKRETDSHPWSG